MWCIEQKPLRWSSIQTVVMDAMLRQKNWRKLFACLNKASDSPFSAFLCEMDQFLNYTTHFYFHISRCDLLSLCFVMPPHVSHLLTWPRSYLNMNSCSLSVERYRLIQEIRNYCCICQNPKWLLTSKTWSDLVICNWS